MPNGSMYKVPYELVLEISTSDKVRDDNKTKVNKVAAIFPRFPYIDGPDRGTVTGRKGDIVQYFLPGDQHSAEAFQPWGSNDIRQSTDDGRYEADGNLIVGETYMVGTGYGALLTAQMVWSLQARYWFNELQWQQYLITENVTELTC